MSKTQIPILKIIFGFFISITVIFLSLSLFPEIQATDTKPLYKDVHFLTMNEEGKIVAYFSEGNIIVGKVRVNSEQDSTVIELTEVEITRRPKLDVFSREEKSTHMRWWGATLHVRNIDDIKSLLITN